ncbi:MAG: hypothetical protein ACTSYG_07560 [Candidatus Heimdallarchaeota archaeon]
MKKYSRKRSSLSCKGNTAVDSIYVMIALVTLAAVSIFGYFVLDKYNDAFQASDMVSEIAKNESAKNAESFDNWTDNLFLVILVGGYIAILALAWFLDNSPIMLFGGLLLLIVVVVVAAQLSNTIVAGFSDPQFAFQSNFPITYYALTHLVEIMAVYILSGLVLLYAKGRAQ